MGVQASSFGEILPGVFSWRCFSPEHKVELTSHAVLVHNQLQVFDPIELCPEALRELLAGRRVSAIVLTNANHERAAIQWHEHTGAPIWAAQGAGKGVPGVTHWLEGQRYWEPWNIVPLPGGVRGEVALRWEEKALLILGDAVFNLPEHGFGVLPEKYCEDRNLLKDALYQLSEQSFETVLLAHGAALQGRASERIRELVEK